MKSRRTACTRDLLSSVHTCLTVDRGMSTRSLLVSLVPLHSMTAPRARKAPPIALTFESTKVSTLTRSRLLRVCSLRPAVLVYGELYNQKCTIRMLA